MAQGKRFRFFTGQLSTRVKSDESLFSQWKKAFEKFWKFLKSIWTGRFFRDQSVNVPTYDLSDQGVNVQDATNFRAAPYVLGKKEL